MRKSADEAELYALIRRAWPYRNLAHRRLSHSVLGMLAEGFTARRGRRARADPSQTR